VKKSENLFFGEYLAIRTKRPAFGQWLAIKAWEFVNSVHTCKKCNRNVAGQECSGILKDFYVNPRDGQEECEGIPLCDCCLGTGKYIRSEKFLKLQKEAIFARTEICGILKKAKIIGVFDENLQKQISLHNDRLKKIAKSALALVRYPDENSLAVKISEGFYEAK
jgi:hypothetical protein